MAMAIDAAEIPPPMITPPTPTLASVHATPRSPNHAAAAPDGGDVVTTSCVNANAEPPAVSAQPVPRVATDARTDHQMI